MRIANLLAAAVIISSGLPVFAEGTTAAVKTNDNVIARCPMGPGGSFRGHGNGCDKFGRLDLSDEQNEKLYQLKQKFADQIGMTKVEMKRERRKMRDLLTQATIDRKAIEAAQIKLNTFKTTLANAKLAFKLDASEILTAEQRKQLRYGTFSSGWGKGQAKVSEVESESTLLSLVPDMDLDLSDAN